MLHGSLNQPTRNVSLGDHWYSLASRSLFEYVTTLTGYDWVPINVLQYMTPQPVIQTNGMPVQKYWIDPTDIYYIPHEYNAASNQWIPIVPLTFSFPPIAPPPGTMWINPITVNPYMWTGAIWLQANSIGAGNVQVQNSVHAGAGVAAGGIFPVANTPIPTNFSLTGQLSGVAAGSPTIVINGAGVQKSLAAAVTFSAVTFPAGGPAALIIDGIVEVMRDGTLSYFQSTYTPNEAAKAFWQAVVQHIPPGVTTVDIEDLIKKVEYAKSIGVKFPEDQKPIDPLDAWNRAMGIIAP